MLIDVYFKLRTPRGLNNTLRSEDSQEELSLNALTIIGALFGLFMWGQVSRMRYKWMY